MTRLLVKNGTVCSVEGSRRADILAVDGVIELIGADLDVEADEVVDATGKLVIPGGVDVHTHLEAPVGGTVTADDFSSGTIAAAAGGTTTIIDFALQERGVRIPDAVERWHRKAESKVVIDFGLHLSITDLYPTALADLPDVVRDGVTSFKIFMAYRGTLMIDDGELYRVLKAAGKLGAQVCAHAENGDVIDQLALELFGAGKVGPKSHQLSRPPSTEVEAVRRAIAIADIADAPIYFVHLSTAGAVDAVAEARHHGQPVAGETCTHYLTLGPELYDAPGFEGAKAVLTPPLRGASDRAALWRGLSGGALSVVSSDHCPFCFEGQKEMGKHDFRAIPNGGPGIEHRMILLYAEGVVKGRISMEKFVDLTATTPAREFGLAPRKGSIAVGADADLVVLDPAGETVISAATSKHQVDYSLWEGWQVPGRIELVYSRGDLIIRDGLCLAAPGRGRYLARSTR